MPVPFAKSFALSTRCARSTNTYNPCNSRLLQQHLQANLSAAQLAQLQQAWERYQSTTAAARQQCTAAVGEVQYAAAAQSLSWQKQSMTITGGSSAERAQVGCARRAGRGLQAGLASWGAVRTCCRPACTCAGPLTAAPNPSGRAGVLRHGAQRRLRRHAEPR